ncbi:MULTISPECIES: rRNA maturation RNase YbeY [Nonlabens]|uniref:Endoribonuclease YbeY n=2 Tax=Nonlabens ulvanivorans TaxID=906888 RepID=A0A081D771_NONUL|nr:rRNA maturation RNase YbeY [Nonlabens ulvanivorans]GAK74767.1 metal-dependent hydrolase YbeY [Nonlabens ulvanivorans]GAK98643.1 metal-dependent hydrolase YbeY [Nonlabens ulvanivorans]
MVDFNYQFNFELSDEVRYSKWLRAVALSENKSLGDLSYVFCTDDFLLEINQKYLNHDTLTDIITFDYCDDDFIHGEIYISVDRVKDNAKDFVVSFDDELLRVMSHGLLHLIGFGDKTDIEKSTMRLKEDEKIKMFHVKQ